MAHRLHKDLNLQGIYLVIAGIFCLACLILSAQTPKLSFEINVQIGSDGNEIVVRRVSLYEDKLQPGDIIESVNRHPVHTKAEFYHDIKGGKKSVDVGVRRVGARLRRPVRSSEFDHGAIPVGIQSNDKPIAIADDAGHMIPLENINFDGLQSLLAQRDQAVNVVFRRPEEILHANVDLQPATERTVFASFLLIFLGLMGVAAYRTRRPMRRSKHFERALRSAMFAVMGMMTIVLWSIMPANPLLMMCGLCTLSLFKAVDLDAHLAMAKPIDPLVRVGIYIGPIASLLVPSWLYLCEIPILWGDSIEPSNLRVEAFAFLPLLWTSLYTLIDFVIQIIQRRQNPASPVSAHEVGTAFAAILAIFVFILMRSDMASARIVLLALILCQSTANLLPSLVQKRPNPTRTLEDPLFSLAPIRLLLDDAQQILGSQASIHLVIDRPSPRHVVSLSRALDDDSLCGIEINMLPRAWRDFIDVMRIEEHYLNGEFLDDTDADPVSGIAQKLGIVLALPIAENVAGSLSQVIFVVCADDLSLSPNDRDELMEILDALSHHSAAMVYHSAEMSLDYLDNSLDEHVASSFDLPSCKCNEIPHGFEEDDEICAQDEVPNPQTIHHREIQNLKSQVFALCSQQFNAIAETEFSSAQQAILDDMANLDPPFLIIGETGTGKKTIAMTAHQRRSSGPFLAIDAADIPESIFKIEVFGDSENIGLLENAAGGALFVENVDRLSAQVRDELIASTENLPARSSIGLYLSMQTSSDDFSVTQYRRDPSCLPQKIQKLAQQCDAEIIAIEPLREQNDIERIANFLRQKAAIHANRNVDTFDERAIKALHDYAWPGNFNELSFVIARAVRRATSSALSVQDLGAEFEDLIQGTAKVKAQIELGDRVQKLQTINEMQVEQIRTLHAKIQELENQSAQKNDDNTAFLDGTYADIEKRLLARILEKYQNDPEKAANALELNRARFFNKLNKYHLLDFS